MATQFIYGLWYSSTANKEADWNSDTIKVMLTTATYTPNQDTHQYKSSVTNEITGTNYTAGGVALTTPAFIYTAGTNTWALDADDATWTTVTFTGVRYAVVYDSTPATDATRPLLMYIDFGSDQAVTAANFVLQWSASGLITATVA